MRFQCFFVLFLLLSSGSAQSQVAHWCGTAVHDQVIATSRSVPQHQGERERIAPFLKAQEGLRSGSTITVPVVVHIVTFRGLGDISDEQVKDGLAVLNEDFNRQNADTVNTRPLFRDIAADVGIEFKLAQLDSNGNPTTGIVRIDSTLIPHPEPVSPDFDNVKFITHWPSDRYYNIWLVYTIQGGTLGYAQYPGTDFTYGGPWSTWGIVMRSDHWGRIGTAVNDGRTATHEVGHSFGLYHTFLNTTANCGSDCDTTGDEVCDTPPCKLTTDCTEQENTCINDTLGPSAFLVDSVDQIENYMGYNTCNNLFSKGQKNRMLGYIAAFPNIQNLISDANLIATGVKEVPLSAVTKNTSGLNLNFQNPAQESVVLNINLSKASTAQVELIHSSGQILLSHRLSDPSRIHHRVLIDLSSYPSGIYWVRCRAGQHSLVKKLVIQ